MNADKQQPLLGGLSSQQFLTHYWQKKPLLIRQAFPNFHSPISPEELAGLSCDTDAPARILVEKGLGQAWKTLYGPFDTENFAELPETHWTLLVNDVERYYPELRDKIIESFRFLPDWRIDDLMVSFAVQGGSVGPHTDEYDVFLIQAQGQRHWQIADYPIDEGDLIANIDLRILKSIEPEQEWTLNAGDMLYLPPHIIHNGVAVNDCMTFSVGFRAPQQQELLSSYFDHCLEQLPKTARYSDPQRQVQADSGEIDPESLEELVQMLHSGLNNNPNFMQQCIGRYLTQSKGESSLIPLNDSQEHYIVGQDYQRLPESRFAYTVDADKINFFANGSSRIYSVNFIESAKFLCKYYSYKENQLSQLMQNSEFSACFTWLLKNKAIFSLTG